MVKNTCRCTEVEQSVNSPRGLTSETPIATAFTWCVALKKYLVHQAKKSAAHMIHRVVMFLEVLGNTAYFKPGATQKNFLCIIHFFSLWNYKNFKLWFIIIIVIVMHCVSHVLFFVWNRPWQWNCNGLTIKQLKH